MIKVKDNNEYLSEETQSALVPILRSPSVKNQIVRLGVGSSSSRARVYADDLEGVRIPILSQENLIELSTLATKNALLIWNQSQEYIKNHVKMQTMLDSIEDKDTYRSI